MLFPENVQSIAGALPWIPPDPARVLEPTDKAKRKERLKQLKTIHQTRSKLAHGAKLGRNEQNQSMHRGSAINFAVTALKEILTCPEMLAVAEADKRAEAVLLGTL